MSEKTIVVWDLETVPDLLAAARMLNMRLASGPEVREALGPGFPKHPLHKIVCIGALVASRQPEGWRVDALGAPHTGERPEADLIKAFADRIGQLHPQMMFLFALAMIAVGVAMLRPRATAGNPDVRMTGGIAIRLIASGLVVGAVSGFFGIGGDWYADPQRRRFIAVFGRQLRSNHGHQLRAIEFG
jgi:hypothetical protein